MGLAAGQIAYDVDLNAIQAASSLKPICRLVAAGTQSIPDNVGTAVTFSTEDIDTDGFHSVSVNTSRITPTKPGIYRFQGSAYMVARTDYIFINAWVRLNGGTNLAPAGRIGGLAGAQNAAAGPGITSTTGVIPSIHTGDVLVAMNGTTDYVELLIHQDNQLNTAALTNQSGQYSCTLSCVYERNIV